MFPISLCWQPDPHMYSVAGAQESRMGRAVEKFAQVKQSLTAQLEDELELKVGQIVKITNIIDKDWYRYESCNNVVGDLCLPMSSHVRTRAE